MLFSLSEASQLLFSLLNKSKQYFFVNIFRQLRSNFFMSMINFHQPEQKPILKIHTKNSSGLEFKDPYNQLFLQLLKARRYNCQPHWSFILRRTNKWETGGKEYVHTCVMGIAVNFRLSHGGLTCKTKSFELKRYRILWS